MSSDDNKKITLIKEIEGGEWQGKTFRKFNAVFDDDDMGPLTVWSPHEPPKVGDTIQVSTKEYNGQTQYTYKPAGGQGAAGKSYSRRPAELEAAIISSGVLKSMIESKTITKGEIHMFIGLLWDLYLPLCKEGASSEHIPKDPQNQDDLPF